MQIELDYGKGSLQVEVPERNTTVLEPRFVPGVPQEEDTIRQALRNPMGAKPLRDLVSPDDTVAIVFSDKTRPMPNDRVLPVLLAELDRVPSENILLINGIGVHVPNTEQELAEMLGEDILRRYRVVNHKPFAQDELTYVGATTYGNEVWVNSHYMKASVKILTGLIEPHVFAGFSGGPKAVLPGVAAESTILRNHAGQMICHPKAVWGVTEGNPVYEEIRQIAALTKPAFILNVTINKLDQITGVFAGEMLAAHAAGTDFARKSTMQKVSGEYDIVITSNSGYPLDLNVYQSVKGMMGAMRIVKRGGAIIVAAECSDGVPDWGNYKPMLTAAKNPQKLLEIVNSPEWFIFDREQAHMHGMVVDKARVFLKCETLSDEEIREIMLEPCQSIEATLHVLLDEFGPEATIAVLPEGPQVIPYIAS